MNIKYEKYQELFYNKLKEYQLYFNDRTKKQCIFYGIRMISIDKKKTNDTYTNILRKIEEVIVIMKLISTLTPLEFMNLFPITKCYDGEKYECKDYLNVKKNIYTYAVTERIGEDVEDFLMLYLNTSINSFVATYLCYINTLTRYELQQGIIDVLLNLDEIDSYSKVTINNKEFMRNNTTGEISKVKKTLPNYIRIIK